MRKQGSFSHLLGKSVVILAFDSFNCGYEGDTGVQQEKFWVFHCFWFTVHG
jgi:hypothetical protein